MLLITKDPWISNNINKNIPIGWSVASMVETLFDNHEMLRFWGQPSAFDG
jgi:hypothetical protein